jgi:hypothetical protein
MARSVRGLRFAFQITSPSARRTRRRALPLFQALSRSSPRLGICRRLEKHAADRFSGAVLVVKYPRIDTRAQQGVGEGRGFSRPLTVMGWKLPSWR